MRDSEAEDLVSYTQVLRDDTCVLLLATNCVLICYTTIGNGYAVLWLCLRHSPLHRTAVLVLGDCSWK